MDLKHATINIVAPDHCCMTREAAVMLSSEHKWFFHTLTAHGVAILHMDTFLYQVFMLLLAVLPTCKRKYGPARAPLCSPACLYLHVSAASC